MIEGYNMKKLLWLSLGALIMSFQLKVSDVDATSKLYNESKMVGVSASSTKVYNDSSLKKVKLTAKRDKVYKVDGYHNIKGKKYYRVYQDKYVGYIQAAHTKIVAFKKVDHDVKGTNDYTLWQNLYFSGKKGKVGRIYEARGYYQLPSGKRYYSLDDERTDR